MITEIKIYPETNSVQVISTEGAVQFTAEGDFIMLLKKGSTGEQVKELQTLLGLDPDGTFGKVTESAVMSFQKSKGLLDDGIVGDKTWIVLIGQKVDSKPYVKLQYLVVALLIVAFFGGFKVEQWHIHSMGI